MNEVRWKLKTFSGKVKTRTGYVLERMAYDPLRWEVVTVADSQETLVFDQYPLGQAVPKIIDVSNLKDVKETSDE